MSRRLVARVLRSRDPLGGGEFPWSAVRRADEVLGGAEVLRGGPGGVDEILAGAGESGSHDDGAGEAPGYDDGAGFTPPGRRGRVRGRIGRRVALVRVRHDRHHLLTRLRVMAVLGAMVAVAVAIDGGGRDGGARAGGATEPAGGTGLRPAALMPGAAPGVEGPSTWFCAAGTAGDDGMADHTVLMFNAGETDAEAVLTVVPGTLTGDVGATSEATAAEEGTTPSSSTTSTTTDGAGDLPEPVVETVEVPAGERVDVRLSDHVEAQMAAALVEVQGGEVVVEHRIKGEHGGDTGPCATTTASTWHLAWGTTARDARDIVVVFNPYPTDVTVDAVFTNEEGRRAPVRFQGLPVPAGSVVGIDVGLDVTRSDHVAATFEAHGGRVVVERLQELDGSLGARGLSLALAVPEAAQTWVLADGGADAPAATEAGDAVTTTERLVVYNPGEERAEAQVQLVPAPDEQVPPPPAFGLSVAAGGYQVVDVGGEDRLPAGAAHATVVRSTNGQPVVVERVTADHPPDPADGSGDSGGSGTTATSGSPLVAGRWAFATVADPTAGARTEFVVFNPDPQEAVEVRVVLRRQTSSGDDDEDDEDDDTHVAAEDPLDPVSVPPGGRAVIEVDAERAAAARAALVDAGGPVVVERVVRLTDGRRRSMRPGLPLASTAVVLDDLAADGRLGGIPPA